MLAAIAVKARICRVGKIACHAVDRLLGARAIPGRSRGQVLPTRIAPGAPAWARRAKLGDAGICEGRAFAHPTESQQVARAVRFGQGCRDRKSKWRRTMRRQQNVSTGTAPWFAALAFAALTL